MVVQARVRVGHPLLLRLYDVPQIRSVWEHAFRHDGVQVDSLSGPADFCHSPASKSGTTECMPQEKSGGCAASEKPSNVAVARKRGGNVAKAVSHSLQHEHENFPPGSDSGSPQHKLATPPPSDSVAAVSGPKSLFRRKNVLTIDLCDPELRNGLVQFFELYNGIPLAT